MNRSVGAITNARGRVIVPAPGTEVEVEKTLGKSLVASGAATEAKSRRTRRPAENTAAPGPSEAREVRA